MPAVPQPRHRGARFRRRREALRLRRRGGELHQLRLGPARRDGRGPGLSRHLLHARQSLRGSPFPIGTPQTKPTAEGGALRSQSPRRAPGEPRLLSGALLRVDPATGDALPDNPLFARPTRTSAGSSPTASGTFPDDRQAGNQRSLDRRRGLGQVGRAQPVPDLSTARNFGWPCFEGNIATPYTGLNICPTAGGDTLPFFTYSRARPSSRATAARREAPRSQAWRSTRAAATTRDLQQRALLFGLRAQVHVGDVPGRRRRPRPRDPVAVRLAAAPPWISRSARTATSTTSTSTAADRPRQVRPVAKASGAPLSGSRRSTVNFRRRLRAGPDRRHDDVRLGPRRRRRVRRLGRRRILHVHELRDVPRAAQSHRQARRLERLATRSRSRPTTSVPTAIIDTPTSTLTWKVDERHRLLRRRRPTQDGNLPDTALAWTVPHPALPVDCHDAHVPDVRRGRRRQLSGARPRIPGPPRDPADRDRLRRAGAHASVQLQPQTVNLQFQSVPTGLQLSVGTFTGTTPFTRQAIKGSSLHRGGFPSGLERLLVVVRRRRAGARHRSRRNRAPTRPTS